MTRYHELHGAADDVIEDAVRYADPMVLRGLLHQLTGDESIKTIGVTDTLFGFVEAKGLADPADAKVLQSKAADLLRSLRDDRVDDVPIGPRGRLAASLGLCAGTDLRPSEVDMWIEQLAVDPWARGPRLDPEQRSESTREFTVAVLGAGAGGLGAAVHLARAGFRCVVIEKNSAVGGTWHENRYPGARVDTPSRMYRHTFGVDFECPSPFGQQSQNEKYLNWVADRFGVRENIEFDTEVESLTWDDKSSVWHILARGPDGRREWRVNAVISAVGLFSRPNIPDIPGRTEFDGQVFHTARWPARLDLQDKRVAVIGSGCSGYQLFPEIVDEAGHTSLFQRTPSWVFDVPGYLSSFPPQIGWLDRNLPFFTNFTRFRVSWLFGPDTQGRAFQADLDFVDDFARSAMNKRARDQRVEFMRAKFADRPDLVEKMLPHAPPLSSRPVVVDPERSIYDALLRDDVTLVTDPIVRFRREGLETESGDVHPADVVVFATGFKANDFLWPMEVRGHSGRRIEDLWAKDGARAYLGAMLPGFPNFFTLYGPNTNPGGGLGVLDVEEMTVRFAVECLLHVATQHKGSVEVTTAAYETYNRELDRLEQSKIYIDRRSRNYFQNEHGRSAVNCPFDTRDLWAWLRRPTTRTLSSHEMVNPHFGADLVVR